jgi:hypothetical protein
MHVEESYNSATAVVPSDTAEIPLTRALYVGGAGNLAVTMSDGATVTFTGLTVGTILKIAVQQVKATNTTATNLLALY